MTQAGAAPECIRKRKKHLPALLFLVLLAQPRARTEPPLKLAIIVNPKAPIREISPEDLKSIFLGTKTSLHDGNHLQPVLERGGPAHAAFLRQYLGKTDIALQTYYRSLIFSGRGTVPAALGSDAEVVKYVERTRGAIGYVLSSSVSPNVKTVEVR